MGIADPSRLLDELWTCLNNPQKVSANLLSRQTVQVINIAGVSVVRACPTSDTTAASLQEAFPLYLLDYQERPEAKTEARWVDRRLLLLVKSELQNRM